MADSDNGAAQPQPPQMKVLGQFIRDLSFENIVSRKPIEGDVKPDIQVQVALDAKKRGENQ
ncbi:MAG: protein-export chaperone SecB, partial [Boseongicola sp.]